MKLFNAAPRWENIKERFRPQRRIARVTLLGAVLYLVGSIIEKSFPESLAAFLQNLGALLLLAGGVYYLFRLFLWLKRKLLWKVRNKLIVSYAFVGVVPLLLLCVMIFLGAKLIFGQLGAYYVNSEIDKITDELEGININLHLTELRRGWGDLFAQPASFQKLITKEVRS